MNNNKKLEGFQSEAALTRPEQGVQVQVHSSSPARIWKDNTVGQCAGLKIQKSEFDPRSFHQFSNKERRRKMAKNRIYFQNNQKELYRQDAIALKRAKRLRDEQNAKNEETNKIRAALDKYAQENVPVVESAETPVLETGI